MDLITQLKDPLGHHYPWGFFIDKMKLQIEWSRWATSQEIDNFIKSTKTAFKNKEDFTNTWLTQHGQVLIRAHQSFYEDYLTHVNQKHQQDYIKRVELYNKKLSEYQSIKNSNRLCNCKGNLRHIVRDEYEFIGCENYREQGFDHFRLYPPSYPYPAHYETSLELNTAYLGKLKDLNNFPKGLKESILYEYLIMNNVTTYVDLSKKFTLLPNISKKSERREKIIKPILDTIFEKVYHQKWIKYKGYNEIPSLIRPDFICMKNNTCYVVEQKKNVDNVNYSQLEKYIACLEYMINIQNKDIPIHGIFIIEEGEPDIENHIYTMDTILTL